MSKTFSSLESTQGMPQAPRTSRTSLPWLFSRTMTATSRGATPRVPSTASPRTPNRRRREISAATAREILSSASCLVSPAGEPSSAYQMVSGPGPGSRRTVREGFSPGVTGRKPISLKTNEPCLSKRRFTA